MTREHADILQQAKAAKAAVAEDALRHRGPSRWFLMRLRGLFAWVERQCRDELEGR